MNPRKPPSFELRVLQGEQQGACTAVPAGTEIRIGSHVDNDIVLRGLADAQDGELRLSVRAAADGVHLSVQQGRVQADGRTVAAGQTLLLPLGTPLTLGPTQIALGLADVADVADVADRDDAAPAEPTAARAAAPGGAVRCRGGAA